MEKPWKAGGTSNTTGTKTNLGPLIALRSWDPTVHHLGNMLKYIIWLLCLFQHNVDKIDPFLVHLNLVATMGRIWVRFGYLTMTPNLLVLG